MMTKVWRFERLVSSYRAEALNELPKQSSTFQILRLTASILRTHSQCQIRRAYPSITVLSHGEPFLFISRLYLMARAVSSQDMVEPIGIEPMT